MLLAEKRVEDALKVREAELRAQPHHDKVSSTLMNLFAPETCPHCSISFEHAGACALMYCEFCKHHFCLYCKLIIKSTKGGSKKDDISAIGHEHVFNCEKKPDLHQILSGTVLFPVFSGPSDGLFMDAFFKTRRLEMLEFQLQQGECTLCIICCRAFHNKMILQIGHLKNAGAWSWILVFRKF
jgi:hypothetical protein